VAASRRFCSPALDFKGQPVDAKVTVEMKGWDAKGAFLKKFRGHREHMLWKDFLTPQRDPASNRRIMQSKRRSYLL
jgi:hypothetical protein